MLNKSMQPQIINQLSTNMRQLGTAPALDLLARSSNNFTKMLIIIRGI